MSIGTQIPDFDTLVALYKQDPEAFNQLRRYLLRNAVDEAPAIHRDSLQQLLDRMETARDNAATPTEAAFTAFRMMQDSVNQLHSVWEQARHAAAGLQAALLIERLRR